MALELPQIGWDSFGAAIAATGALGIAAFGVVEALGKALVVPPRMVDRLDQTFAARVMNPRIVPVGLPFVGFNQVRELLKCLKAALAKAYGPSWENLIAQQYREGRNQGDAPASVRQGVKLALPMMTVEEAAELIDQVWGLDREKARVLAVALTSDHDDDAPGAEDDAARQRDRLEGAALAGHFALVLDSRISAAFSQAEERYGSIARMWSGLAAVILSLMFNAGLKQAQIAYQHPFHWRYVEGAPTEGYPWLIAIIIGLAAVPLAPIAKDLASSLSDASKAWRQIGGK